MAKQRNDTPFAQRSSHFVTAVLVVLFMIFTIQRTTINLLISKQVFLLISCITRSFQIFAFQVLPFGATQPLTKLHIYFCIFVCTNNTLVQKRVQSVQQTSLLCSSKFFYIKLTREKGCLHQRCSTPYYVGRPASLMQYRRRRSPGFFRSRLGQVIEMLRYVFIGHNWFIFLRVFNLVNILICT